VVVEICWYVPSCLLCWDTVHLLQLIGEVTGGLEGWASNNRWDELGITAQLQQHSELKWVYP
jgi:hypothetical protein